MTRATHHDALVEITTPQAAPHWALLERQLLDAQCDAIELFYKRYFDSRGYLLCVPRWSANDGPDDAAENLLNWPLVYALGGSERVMELYRTGWEGHLLQYTEAKTTEIEKGKDGVYFKEFHACFDWFHHGEALNAFVLEGLADPHDETLIRRMKRFAGMWMGEDPIATNWDPEHKLIRSMMTGSRGPLLRQATALDWAGERLEVEGRFKALHGEHTYEQFLEHYRDYNDVVGDNWLNLASTSLAFCAYALTGEQKYRDWLVTYVDQWVRWSAENDGIMPSSIGLDGKVGSQYGWWGGVYGWGFTVETFPFDGRKAHRNYQTRTPYAFANAMVVTGERGYLDTWKGMYEKVNANTKTENGQTLYPHMFGRPEGISHKEGEPGWYEYRPRKWSPGVEEMYYWTLDRGLLELAPEKPRWFAYLDGELPEYPAQALQHDLERLRRKVEEIRADTRTPDTTLSDDMNAINPATIDALTRLMLGGLPTGRHGYPLHCRVRYFDPERRRAGLPQDVAALVDRITDDEVGVTLVNLSPMDERTVIVQGGAYAEHHIESVKAENGTETAVDHSHFAVSLAPGAGERLTISMRRFANSPTMAQPWV
ncbi:MAG: hypothetical protein AVDCRST_MAG77-1629 [uncultured Chloroflexi bacterium]|uniref:Uncharacterized protein n=1 Tax=uncultured Chloroflexota bacterium TaxID=166587 RepID=A0A6J4I1X7_9CHLR|nr:MAG: hypothetical protein AVDCRST_MAG77-1629 [uncultured Chloroflexota bacterium]